MLTDLKALIVVLVIAAGIFALARPVCLRFTASTDFDRRRWVWFVLTGLAFLSPSFWLYALFAAPLMFWAAKRDTSPIALYLLLVFVIPPFSVEIPVVGINRLFGLDQYRLLGIFALLPSVLRLPKELASNSKKWLVSVDLLLLLYGALQLILFMPYESLTNTLRRAFLYLLDTYLVYYAFRRIGKSRETLTDAIGALCLAASIYAPLSLFESQRKWLLYTGIGNKWGVGDAWAYLLRGDSLRAQVSLGHSLTLGFSLAIGVGTWMYLKSSESSKTRRSLVFGLLSIGLFFTYSRAPWLAAALMPILYLGLSSKSLASFVRNIAILVLVAGVVAVTPLGDSIISLLPGVGSQGQETVDYRQQLAETSWRLIQLHPLLGNPFVLLDMEELRQGQGIIDLVNAYAAVALFYGLIGLTLYCGVFITAITAAGQGLLKARAEGDSNMIGLGAALITCMVVTMLFMGTAGFAWAQWQLVGLVVGYAGLQSTRPAPLPAFRAAFAT